MLPNPETYLSVKVLSLPHTVTRLQRNGLCIIFTARSLGVNEECRGSSCRTHTGETWIHLWRFAQVLNSVGEAEGQKKKNDRSDLMVQLVEAVAAEEDRAAQVSDAEMDSPSDPQLLLHSRCPPVLACGFACREVTHGR